MSHKQILIVEDDIAISEALAKLLESEGYKVTVAYNGEEGLRILNQTKSSPCLILLDLIMPLMNGFRFREKQLLLADHKNVPVVVMSAVENLGENAASIKAQEYIRKPLDVPTCLDMIKRYCG